MTGAELSSALRAKFPDLQDIPRVAAQARGDELYLAVPHSRISELCPFLKNDASTAFDFLSFLTAIDWKTHFELVYYLVSTRLHHKLVLKVKLEERANPELASVTSVWATADWQEREIFDLFGIRFTGHYNMRRILLPDDWEGFPLRKDYVAKPDRYD